MSINELIHTTRSVATELGVKLPMNKLQDAITRATFGKPYNAVIAASRAGKLSEIPPPNALNEVAAEYRISAYAFSSAFHQAGWPMEGVELAPLLPDQLSRALAWLRGLPAPTMDQLRERDLDDDEDYWNVEQGNLQAMHEQPYVAGGYIHDLLVLNEATAGDPAEVSARENQIHKAVFGVALSALQVALDDGGDDDDDFEQARALAQDAIALICIAIGRGRLQAADEMVKALLEVDLDVFEEAPGFDGDTDADEMTLAEELLFWPVALRMAHGDFAGALKAFDDGYWEGGEDTRDGRLVRKVIEAALDPKKVPTVARQAATCRSGAMGYIGGFFLEWEEARADLDEELDAEDLADPEVMAMRAELESMGDRTLASVMEQLTRSQPMARSMVLLVCFQACPGLAGDLETRLGDQAKQKARSNKDTLAAIAAGPPLVCAPNAPGLLIG